jgi:hypothetical protein
MATDACPESFGWLEEEGFSIKVSDHPDDYELDAEWPPRPTREPPRDVLCVPLKVLARWKFNKNDADPWPSVLHGHHSERPLKLDAISGDIFNIHTRQRVQRMKPKELARVQTRLLDSKDFGERARSLFAGSS